MAKVPLGIKLLILGFSLWMILSSHYRLFAQPPGCCKQRDSREGDWYKNGLNFDQCQQWNRRKDRGDNVFDKQGFVWWDLNCQG
jgi:hypothetical protein